MKNKIKNSLLGRLVCLLVVFLILKFQVHSYPFLYMQINFLFTSKEFNASVMVKDDERLVLKFQDETGRIVEEIRDISNYNPFKKLNVGDNIIVKYSAQVPYFIIIQEYDEEPVFIFILFSFIILIAGEIFFLLISMNLIDEKILNKNIK